MCKTYVASATGIHHGQKVKRKKKKGGIFFTTTVHPGNFSSLGLLKSLFQLRKKEQLFHAFVSRLFLRVGVRWRARVRAGPVVLQKKRTKSLTRLKSYYAESISYFVKLVGLRRIDLIFPQIGRTTQYRSRTSSNRCITQNRSRTRQIDNKSAAHRVM